MQVAIVQDKIERRPSAVTSGIATLERLRVVQQRCKETLLFVKIVVPAIPGTARKAHGTKPVG